MNSNHVRNLAFSAGLAFYSSATFAAMITQVGDGVAFTYDDSTVFGVGNVVGDFLVFAPTEITAEAVGENQFDSTVADLSVTITVLDDDFFLNLVGVAESGDYLLSGDASQVDVLSTLSIDADADSNFDFVDNFSTVDALDQNDGLFHNWSATQVTDISSFASNSIEVTLSTVLIAETFGGEDQQAFIAQKLDQIGVSAELLPISQVPLPGSILFFASFLGLAGVYRIKKAG